MEIDMTTQQNCTVAAEPEDAQGNRALVDGPLTWTCNTPGIVTLTPGQNGLSCNIAGETAGRCVITVTGTAGGNPISAAQLLIVVAVAPVDEATQIVLTPGPVVQD